MAEMLEIVGILDTYPPSSPAASSSARASAARWSRSADLYLLDEPMGQLEPQLRAVCAGASRPISSSTATSIFVTHDQTEANALADRIAVMEGGVLQQFATPEELKERPANLFAGTFIGEPPMNVFEASRPRRRLVPPASARARFTSPPRRSNRILGDHLRQLPKRDDWRPPTRARIGAGPLAGEVVSCQWLGDQTHSAPMSTAAPRSRCPTIACAQSRQSILFVVAAAELHIFDPETAGPAAHGRQARMNATS